MLSVPGRQVHDVDVELMRSGIQVSTARLSAAFSGIVAASSPRQMSVACAEGSMEIDVSSISEDQPLGDPWRSLQVRFHSSLECCRMLRHATLERIR